MAMGKQINDPVFFEMLREMREVAKRYGWILSGGGTDGKVAKVSMRISLAGSTGSRRA